MQRKAEAARMGANAAIRRAELLGDAKDKKDEVFGDGEAVLESVETASRPPAPDLRGSL